MLVPPSSPDPRLARTLVIGGLAASLLSLSVASTALATREVAPADPCAPSFDDASLAPRDRAFVARRVLACSDVAHGRISPVEYRQQIAAIDTAWTATPVLAPVAPAMQWASTVRGVSSQYTASSWAADKVLGTPDVFPAHGDNANAWASLGADDRDEWIEVGYAQPTRISGVEIYETFNPGAITAIELVTASGQHLAAYQATPSARHQSSHVLRAEVGCTDEPIVAVRVKLGSTQVAGWNEIDAIGVAPCQ